MFRFVLVLILTLLGSEARAWTHGAVCSQATTALAALSGLNSAQQAAYVTMICGMVVDGDFAHLSGLWVAAISQANSLVNLTNPGTHNLVNHGTTFANPGWVGDAVAHYLDTGEGTGGTQNSSAFGICVLNSRSTPQTGWIIIGAQNSGVDNFLRPLYASSTTYMELNGNTSPPTTTPTNNAQGSYAVTRTSSSAINLYFNGTGVAGNPISSVSDGQTSAALAILAFNDAGAAMVTTFSGDTVGYAWNGDGSVNPTNLYNRLHTFITDASIGGGAC